MEMLMMACSAQRKIRQHSGGHHDYDFLYYCYHFDFFSQSLQALVNVERLHSHSALCKR